MEGRPVWLASASLWDQRKGEPIVTGQWSGAQRSKMLGALEELLDGIGDPTRERCFRMNVTLCLHRGLSAMEEYNLPAWWHEAPPIHLAGGPIEVLWAKGIPDSPSTRPCRYPGRQPIGKTWLPVDCGECVPCLARAAIEPHDARVANA